MSLVSRGLFLLLALSISAIAADSPNVQPSSLESRPAAKATDVVDADAAQTADQSRSVAGSRFLTERLANTADDTDAATLDFVREHQPELAELLQYLKSKRGSDYADAIKDIRRVRERLENLRKRDRELHDVELALWKNSAQLRLWAASLSASNKRLTPADRSKLTHLVTRENELMTKRLTLEKARTEARLEQLNQQLGKRQEQGASMIAKGIKAWESRIERTATKNKNKTPLGDDKKTETKNTDTKSTSDRS